MAEIFENKKKQVTIYTDGACSGNPGKGGWGAVLIYGEIEKELSGKHPATTNNRMELTAVISALQTLKFPCKVNLFTDSKYIVDAINQGWAKKWQSNNWTRSNKEKALNPDLWQTLLELLNIHEVVFNWVKGHAGNKYNERCDELATS
ncbi:MAG: ribonuclease HI [Oscillospiraceae bacterium]